MVWRFDPVADGAMAKCNTCPRDDLKNLQAVRAHKRFCPGLGRGSPPAGSSAQPSASSSAFPSARPSAGLSRQDADGIEEFLRDQAEFDELRREWVIQQATRAVMSEMIDWDWSIPPGVRTRVRQEIRHQLAALSGAPSFLEALAIGRGICERILRESR